MIKDKGLISFWLWIVENIKLQKYLNLTYAVVPAVRNFNTVTRYTTEILLPAKADFSLVQQFQYCPTQPPLRVVQYSSGRNMKQTIIIQDVVTKRSDT